MRAVLAKAHGLTTGSLPDSGARPTRVRDRGASTGSHETGRQASDKH